ncbi:MAG: hypothetical protein WCF90_09775 [Methanomicrobiales archaeon]
MKATIDRIEEGIAVLISSEGDPIRLNVPVSLLPPGKKKVISLPSKLIVMTR